MDVNKMNLFSGSVDDIATVDIDSFLISFGELEYFDLQNWLSQKANDALTENDIKASEILRFLEAICSIWGNYESTEEPFRPMAILDGKRTIIPEDLTDQDQKALVLIADKVKHPLLAARVNDLVWYLHAAGKDSYRYAQAAIHFYLEIVKSVNNEENFSEGLNFLKRAYLLSKSIRSKEDNETCIFEFERYIEIAISSPKHRNLSNILYTYCLFHLAVNPESMDSIEDIADKMVMAGESYVAKELFLSLAELRKNSNTGKEFKYYIRKAAFALYQSAHAPPTGTSPSMIHAAFDLQDAIVLLQRADHSKEELETWKAQLCEYEEKSNAEMHEFSFSIDLKEPIEAAVKHVSGYDFRTAIIRFAFGYPLVDIEHLKDVVKETRENSIISDLFPITITEGNTGRVLAKSSGNDKKDEQQEYYQIIRQASEFDWRFRVNGYIQPALSAIYFEHHPINSDIVPLVNSSQFIPPGHEGIFLRGLLAGFNGDFLISASLLCPQIENSLRFLLEKKGITARTVNQDGTESYWTLDRLLDDETIGAILGERMVFELKGHLKEEGWGYNLRHQIAHGFIAYDEFLSAEAISLWWLVLRLCIHPEKV